MALADLAVRRSASAGNVSSFAALIPDGTAVGDLILLFVTTGSSRVSDITSQGRGWARQGPASATGLECWWRVIKGDEGWDGTDDSATVTQTVGQSIHVLAVRVRGLNDPQELIASLTRAAYASSATLQYPNVNPGTSANRRWCFVHSITGSRTVTHSATLTDNQTQGYGGAGQVDTTIAFASVDSSASALDPADGSLNSASAHECWGFAYDESKPASPPVEVRHRWTITGDLNPANIPYYLPNGTGNVPGTILVLIESPDWGNISNPTTPAGWTRFMWRDNISAGGSKDFCGYYRVVDGSEGWDGTDDSVTLVQGFSQAACGVVFAILGGYPIADFLASVVYGGQTVSGGVYAARALSAATNKSRLWVHGLHGDSGSNGRIGPPAELGTYGGQAKSGRTSAIFAAVSKTDTGSSPAGFTTSAPTNEVTTWSFYLTAQLIVFEPPAFGAEAGFGDLTFVVGSTVYLMPQRYGAEAGFQPGVVFRLAGSREVMLVGSDLETPEMTDPPPVPESGADLPVLVYRRGSKPEWVQLADLLDELGS